MTKVPVTLVPPKIQDMCTEAQNHLNSLYPDVECSWMVDAHCIYMVPEDIDYDPPISVVVQEDGSYRSLDGARYSNLKTAFVEMAKSRWNKEL